MAGGESNEERRILRIDTGPLQGCSFVYFKDPNGVTLELLESPAGHP